MKTYLWSEFEAAVRAVITDRTPSDTNFAAAAAEYVRGRMTRDLLGDVNIYGLIERRYTSLRRGLAGYNTTQDDAALKASVKALLRDTSGDIVFTDAAANFVRGKLGDAEGMKNYTAQRIRLAGYATTLSDSALKAAVRVMLTDGAVNNQTFAEACALFVRRAIVREVDLRVDSTYNNQASLSLADSLDKDYERLRLRLVGFTQTIGNTAAVVTEVNKYLPADSQSVATSRYPIAKVVSDMRQGGPYDRAQLLVPAATSQSSS